MSQNNEASNTESKTSSTASDSSVMSFAYSIAKKVCVVGAVYFAGYMHWSVAWFLGPLVLSVMREQWRKESDVRRTIAKASAMTSEKEVILARLDELPAWVFFPDIERAEWLNRILFQVWPNVNHYARNIIKESIEPNIQKSLTSYKLNGFKFERMILGSIPPRVGGVKVYDKNVSRDEMIMDIDLFYAGDCDINFTLGGIKGGIKDFQIHGMLRVVMKPLIKSVPFVGGLQIFFLNNPTIDFNLVGVADILDMPGFSDLMKRCIVEQIAAMMVLPNKLPIKLSDDVLSHDIKMPEPEGVLRIHVVEAKDLMKKDISVLGKGKSDPYALISVGAQVFRTQTIDNTVNPKWDYWCESPILHSSGQKLELKLFDQDDISKTDENLGRCTVEIASVSKKGYIDTWLTLEQAKHGMVHIRIMWHNLTASMDDLKLALKETQILCVNGMSTAIFTIYIDSCKNLPNARPQSKPDPYIALNVGKKNENTSVCMRTADPIYEIGYTFLIANPENDTIHLKVIDQKTGNQIGIIDYDLTGLLNKTNFNIDIQPFSLQRSGPDSKIFLAMNLKILKKASMKSEYSIEQPEIQEQQPSDNTFSNVLIDKESTILKENELKVSDQDKAVVDSATALNSQLDENSPVLVRRTLSTTSSSGEAGLGRIQTTLRYNPNKQRLNVIIHKIANIPLKDPSNIPDPYVKLYLLPSRSKVSKRKTTVMKDNCNPVYDEAFEYIMSQGECNSQSLEITVASQKGFFAGGSPVIGEATVNLNEHNLIEGKTLWLDLLHPTINN